MKEMKSLKNKVTDYKNFANILLAVSTIFYIGIVLKGMEETNFQLAIIITVTYFLLLLSFTFYLYSSKCKKKLIELQDDEQNVM